MESSHLLTFYGKELFQTELGRRREKHDKEVKSETKVRSVICQTVVEPSISTYIQKDSGWIKKYGEINYT